MYMMAAEVHPKVQVSCMICRGCFWRCAVIGLADSIGRTGWIS